MGVLSAARPALSQQGRGAAATAHARHQGTGEGGAQTARPGVSGRRDRTDAAARQHARSPATRPLRKIDVPYDTEPAFAFHPGPAGPRAHQRSAALRDHHSPQASTAKAPPNLEELAFWPVTELAPLVRSRAVSSTDLTKMYLARMKKYSPKLLCLVTLTEELALQQAAAADARNQGRQVSRTAARHSVRREGSLRHQGHPHHLGRRAVPEARSRHTTPPASSGCTRRARC